MKHQGTITADQEFTLAVADSPIMAVTMVTTAAIMAVTTATTNVGGELLRGVKLRPCGREAACDQKICVADVVQRDLNNVNPTRVSFWAIAKKGRHRAALYVSDDGAGDGASVDGGGEA